MLMKQLAGSGSLYKRGKSWYVHFVDDGKQIKKSLGQCDNETARERADALIIDTILGNRTIDHDKIAKEWRSQMRTLSKNKCNWAGKLFYGAKSRSSQCGTLCNITYNDIIAISIRSGGRCEVTGIPFSWEEHGGARSMPYCPSLDKIVPKEGYTRSNIRLVCNCVNSAMNEWGESVIYRIAAAPYLKVA